MVRLFDDSFSSLLQSDSFFIQKNKIATEIDTLQTNKILQMNTYKLNFIILLNDVRRTKYLVFNFSNAYKWMCYTLMYAIYLCSI